MLGESAPACQIETTRTGALAVLALEGELDLTGVDGLLAHVDWMLGHRPLVLAVDLRALTFMDASGVHALIDAGRRCEERGRRFTVIRRRGDKRQVDRVLEVCGLGGYFDTVDDPDQLPDGELAAVAGL